MRYWLWTLVKLKRTFLQCSFVIHVLFKILLNIVAKKMHHKENRTKSLTLHWIIHNVNVYYALKCRFKASSITTLTSKDLWWQGYTVIHLYMRLSEVIHYCNILELYLYWTVVCGNYFILHTSVLIKSARKWTSLLFHWNKRAHI